jgi:hypothetical protein
MEWALEVLVWGFALVFMAIFVGIAAIIWLGVLSIWNDLLK